MFPRHTQYSLVVVAIFKEKVGEIPVRSTESTVDSEPMFVISLVSAGISTTNEVCGKIKDQVITQSTHNLNVIPCLYEFTCFSVIFVSIGFMSFSGIQSNGIL